MRRLEGEKWSGDLELSVKEGKGGGSLTLESDLVAMLAW